MAIDDTTVIGHRDLDPQSREHDPGPNWEKEWLLANVVPPGELKPQPIAPFDYESWAAAWARGSVPVRYDGEYEVHEISIPRRK